MDFLNYKILRNDELESYRDALSKEYDKLEKKIHKLCDNVIELREEYDEVINEIKNREKNKPK